MTGLIIGAITIIAIIFFKNQSNKKKRKIEADRLQKIKQQEDEQKKIEHANRLERERLNKIEQKKRQEEEKRFELIRLQKVEEKRKLDEVNRVEKERLQRIEDEKYEIVKTVIVDEIAENGKFSFVIKRGDNTYAYVQSTNVFNLNSNLKILKEKTETFNWFSEFEHNKRQNLIKEQIQLQKQIESNTELETIESHQRNFCESDTQFSNHVEHLYNQNPINISFSNIRRFSVSYVNQLTSEVTDSLYSELNSGITILETEGHLHQYIYSYGNMHQAKLKQSFEVITNLAQIVNDKDLQIIDYGCGQGIGTFVFIDHLKAINQNNYVISKVRLIEPSELALKRASLNIKYSLRSVNQNENVLAIHKELDNITNQDLMTNFASIKFHIFSNILDVPNINLLTLCEKINSTQKGINYFICVSPKFWEEARHPRNIRLDTFMSYFQQRHQINIISMRETNINIWKRYERVFEATI